MMDNLKKKKYNHMVLHHDGSHNQLMNLCQDDLKCNGVTYLLEKIKVYNNSSIQTTSSTFYWSDMGYNDGIKIFKHV